MNTISSKLPKPFPIIKSSFFGQYVWAFSPTTTHHSSSIPQNELSEQYTDFLNTSNLSLQDSSLADLYKIQQPKVITKFIKHNFDNRIEICAEIEKNENSKLKQISITDICGLEEKPNCDLFMIMKIISTIQESVLFFIQNCFDETKITVPSFYFKIPMNNCEESGECFNLSYMIGRNICNVYKNRPQFGNKEWEIITPFHKDFVLRVTDSVMVEIEMREKK